MTRYDGREIQNYLARYARRRGEVWLFTQGELREVKAEKPPFVYLMSRQSEGWTPLTSPLFNALLDLTGLGRRMRVPLQGPARPSLFLSFEENPSWEEDANLVRAFFLTYHDGRKMERTWSEDSSLLRWAEEVAMGRKDGQEFFEAVLDAFPRDASLRRFAEMREAMSRGVVDVPVD